MEHMSKLRNMTGVYLLNNDRVLLLYRQGSKVANQTWIASAGGHFEEWELNDAKACALREMKEELSVTEDMITDMKLRYVSLRRTNGEIRQNYYFFANLKDEYLDGLVSDEGELKWFDLDEISDLKMPYSAKYMIEHYLTTGRENDKVYVGVADGAGVVFTALPEY